MYVRSRNYISAAINMFKWKRKEAVVFDIIYHKYSVEDCTSQGELTDDIKYAALCRITGLASSRARGFTLPSRTRKVWTTEVACPKCAYLVMRNVQTYVTRQFDKTAMEAQTAKGLGEKSSWDKLQVISVEKRLMLWQWSPYAF